MDKARQLPSAAIGGELLLRRQGVPAKSRLEFDPASGELRLRPVGVPAPVGENVTVIDQIASDGFA